MTVPEHPATRLRAVVDPGVYVSATISDGPNWQLIEAAQSGRLTLVTSDLLLAELTEVLHRDKFRRWLSVGDAETFVSAIVLISEHAADPSMKGRDPVCRDPDDEYLVALAEATQATFLVSGDRDLLDLDRPGLDVQTAKDVLEALDFRHPWGRGLVPGHPQQAFEQAEVEGHDAVISLAMGFLTLIEDPDVDQVLPAVVTPESLSDWLQNVTELRRKLAPRSVATRPEYPTPDIAYVKLPPDPGITVRAYSHIPLNDTIVLTVQRRPELQGPRELGGWRVHAVGDYVPIEDMPNSTSD